MTRIMGRVFIAILLIAASVERAEAQWFASYATDAFSILASAAASKEHRWRDLDRGEADLSAEAARSFGGFDKGDAFLVASIGGSTALSHRILTSDILYGGFAVGKRIDSNDGMVWSAIDVLLLPSAVDHRATTELSAGAKFRLPHWLPEMPPTLIAEGVADLSRYQAAYLRAALRQGIKFRPALMVFVEGGYAWSGWPPGDQSGSVPFGRHGGDVTLTLVHQNDGRSVEPFVRWIWSDRGHSGATFDVGIRVTGAK